jgi:hypothetical protein
MLPTKFRFIWPSSFRGEDFKKSANQKEELPVVAMFVNGCSEEMLLPFDTNPNGSIRSLLFLAHLAITWRPLSVNFSHFNPLL